MHVVHAQQPHVRLPWWYVSSPERLTPFRPGRNIATQGSRTPQQYTDIKKQTYPTCQMTPRGQRIPSNTVRISPPLIGSVRWVIVDWLSQSQSQLRSPGPWPPGCGSPATDRHWPPTAAGHRQPLPATIGRRKPPAFPAPSAARPNWLLWLTLIQAGIVASCSSQLPRPI